MLVEPGSELLHYRIVEKIGEGGMGVVWKAVDTTLDREVAIKMLPPELTADEQRRARFVREAKLLAALSHPNIAGIHQVEQVDGAQLIVMEMVEGETLAERLSSGRLSTEEALRIALQMTLAFEEAHERGIVHRDLKPANVKITPKDEVKILDFGLAKALEDEPGASDTRAALSHSPTLTAQMTSAGALLGTAAYMSPEQARGDAADRRADIWAFGIVLMEMLTGKTVYAGKTAADTLAGVLARDPAWNDLPDRTPPSIRRLLDRCLQKELRDRLQAIGEARVIIQGYLDDPEADVTSIDAVPRPLWRTALPWALAGAFALAAFLSWFGPWGGAGFSHERPGARRVSLELPRHQKVNRGDGAGAVFSPDGTRVVYNTYGWQNRELHVRAVDQWEGILLHEGDGDELPYNPFFSPDGKWIGFVTPKALKKVRVTGGTAMTLTEVQFSRGASWSEDGSIVFARDGNSGLYRISAAGGEPEVLTELDEDGGETTHRWPEVLPGGGGVLFTSRTTTADGEEWNVELLALTGGERTRLQRNASYGRFLESGHVVYIVDGTIFALPFDLDRLEATGAAVPVVAGVQFNPGNGGAQFSLSEGGDLAYIPGSPEDRKLRPVWSDHEGQVSSLWDSWQQYRDPAISPDGTRLAVTVEKDEQEDIWIYDIDRGVATRLTRDPGNDRSHVWSPDGRFIYFSSDRGGNFNIFRKRSDAAGEVEQLTDGDENEYPSSITSDGNTLAYSRASETTSWDVWLLSLDGSGERTPLLNAPYSETVGRFSPDDRWITYFGYESGEWEVYVASVSGEGKWAISSGGGAWPYWSPDGKELYYWWLGATYAVDVETGGEGFRVGRSRLLFNGALADLGTRLPWTIAPDGERFVGFQPESTGSEHEHVRLVLGWSDEVRRTFAEVGR